MRQTRQLKAHHTFSNVHARKKSQLEELYFLSVRNNNKEFYKNVKRLKYLEALTPWKLVWFSIKERLGIVDKKYEKFMKTEGIKL